MININFLKIIRVIVYFNFLLCLLSLVLIISFAIFGMPKGFYFGEKSQFMYSSKEKEFAFEVSWDAKKTEILPKGPANFKYWIEKEKETALVKFIVWNSKFYILYFSLVIRIVTYYLISIVLFLLFRESKDGNLLHRNAIKKVNWMGITLILFGIINFIVDYNVSELKSQILYETGITKTFHSFYSINFNLLNSFFFGILILAISQIFKRGVELQEENDLTV